MKTELALELYELCCSEKPDLKRAEELIQSGMIDLSEPASPEGWGCYLTSAIDLYNYELAEMLLENGADPNSKADEYGLALCTACLFDTEERKDPKADTQKQFRIARLLLEKGADASGIGSDEEAVLDYVIWRTFAGEDCVPLNDEYGKSAIILMFAYGASGFYKADFIRRIDKERLDNYSIEHLEREDGSLRWGIVEKETNEIIAYLNF